MKRTYCDVCEKELVNGGKMADSVVDLPERPTGSAETDKQLGRYEIQVQIRFFEDLKREIELCDGCFYAMVVKFMKPKPVEAEDIPF